MHSFLARANDALEGAGVEAVLGLGEDRHVLVDDPASNQLDDPGEHPGQRPGEWVPVQAARHVQPDAMHTGGRRGGQDHLGQAHHVETGKGQVRMGVVMDVRPGLRQPQPADDPGLNPRGQLVQLRGAEGGPVRLEVVAAVLLLGHLAEGLQVQRQDVVRLQRVLDRQFPVGVVVRLPGPFLMPGVGEGLLADLVEGPQELRQAGAVIGQVDKDQLAAALGAELAEPGVLALPGAEAAGVGNPAGLAVAVVLPGVVLADEPFAPAVRLAGQPAMAVCADIQEGDDLAVHVADQERLAEHVTGEEVSGLAQLRCRADQVPGRQEQPIDLELVEVRIVVVMGRKQVAQARFMQEHESTPQQTSAWLPPGRKGQSSSVNGTGWAPKMQPDLPGFSISA